MEKTSPPDDEGVDPSAKTTRDDPGKFFSKGRTHLCIKKFKDCCTLVPCTIQGGRGFEGMAKVEIVEYVRILNPGEPASESFIPSKHAEMQLEQIITDPMASSCLLHIADIRSEYYTTAMAPRAVIGAEELARIVHLCNSTSFRRTTERPKTPENLHKVTFAEVHDIGSFAEIARKTMTEQKINFAAGVFGVEPRKEKSEPEAAPGVRPDKLGSLLALTRVELDAMRERRIQLRILRDQS